MAGQQLQAFQYGEQVPAAVVPCEGVHLVDDDSSYASQHVGVVGLDADQHRFERLRGGEQEVGGLGADTATYGLSGVAMPQSGSAAQPLGVAVDPVYQVVQERL